jgi:hypothetical protein
MGGYSSFIDGSFIGTCVSTLVSFFAPQGEYLFFACPKKRYQKKRHPTYSPIENHYGFPAILE